jgi:hypothetical protein
MTGEEHNGSFEEKIALEVPKKLLVILQSCWPSKGKNWNILDDNDMLAWD